VLHGIKIHGQLSECSVVRGFIPIVTYNSIDDSTACLLLTGNSLKTLNRNTKTKH